MKVEVLSWVRDKFSEDDKRLIGKVCVALANIEYEFTDILSFGRMTQIVSAVVYANPLRLDFKGWVPGTNAEGFFFNPQAELTEALFEGSTFTPEFLARLEREVKEYRQRLRKG
jgi:hypothetical protein